MDRHVAFADLDTELANTRRVLERLPGDQLDFRPHEKSWTLAQLATHIANLPGWMAETLTEPNFNLADLVENDSLPTCEAILERFDGHAAALRAVWGDTDEDQLAESWTVRMDDHVVLESPRGVMLRTSGVSHLVHHRAQLTVYLRLLDVPLPNLYGPTADEQ